MAEADALLPGDHTTAYASGDIDSFAEQYALTDNLNVFHKASRLVQHEEIAIDQTPPDLALSELRALRNETESKWHQPWSMYLCIVVNALGAMGQGWAQTSMNGANIYWPRLFGIAGNSTHDTLIVGLINCAIYLSNGLLGSWLVAPLNGLLGRRGAIFAGTLISLASNVFGSVANSWQQLLAGRLLYGVGLGIVSSSLNVFTAECAPATIRGGLGVAWQMFCAFGIFLGFLTNMLVDSNFEEADYGSFKWRIMLAAAAIPAIPLLLLIFVCPESPAYWIKHSDRYDRAFDSLCRLRNTNLQAARDVLVFHHQRQRVTRTTVRSSFLRSAGELFTKPRLRHALLAAWTVMVCQQMCGINVVAFYSSTIFIDARFSPFAAEAASTVFGLVNFLGAFPAVWTMDSLGRRSLLLYTLPPMAITMAVTAVSFDMSDGKFRFGMITFSIYLFCLLYSPGMGPVPAAYSAEVFPLSHRELGASSAMAVTNVLAAVLGLTFPALLSGLGALRSFLVYAAGNVVAWWLVYLFVRETKQRTLEQLDDVFSVPTRHVIKRQMHEVLPWWIRKYVLLRKNEKLRPDEVGVLYGALGQNDDHDGD